MDGTPYFARAVSQRHKMFMKSSASVSQHNKNNPAFSVQLGQNKLGCCVHFEHLIIINLARAYPRGAPNGVILYPKILD
jgi:hypothetical protein